MANCCTYGNLVTCVKLITAKSYWAASCPVLCVAVLGQRLSGELLGNGDVCFTWENAQTARVPARG